MNKYLMFFLLTVILSFLIACEEKRNLLTNPNNTVPSDSVIVPLSPIDSKLIIKIIEEISPSNRNVVLCFYTEKTYSPAGSKISANFIQEADTFKIELKGLLISDMGAAIFTPASVTFNLNSLQQGSCFLDITVNNKNILALLTVTKESFELMIQPNNLIYIYQDILFRVPNNIIWGQAESIKQIPYQIFLDSLEVLGAQPHNLRHGGYFYFNVYSNGSFSMNFVLGMSYGEFFLYNFEGDTLTTRSLVKRFAKRYLDSIYIKLMGGRGEMYYSTVLKNEP